jgi:hypothetical protein
MLNSDRIVERLKIIFGTTGTKLHKILTISILLIFISYSNSFSQLTEIGFQLGAFNYTGDLSNGYSLKNHRPGGSVFLRSNITDAVGLKYGIAAGMLHGSNEYFLLIQPYWKHLVLLSFIFWIIRVNIPELTGLPILALVWLSLRTLVMLRVILIKAGSSQPFLLG